MRPLQLAKAECCNYFAVGPYRIKDYCCREPQPADQEKYRCLLATGSNESCKWFIEAVGPQDGEALAEYLSVLGGNACPAKKQERRATCQTCGQPFKTTSNRAQYCSKRCRETARKSQYRDSKKCSRTKNSAGDEVLLLAQIPQLEGTKTRITGGSIHGKNGKVIVDVLPAIPIVDIESHQPQKST